MYVRAAVFALAPAFRQVAIEPRTTSSSTVVAASDLAFLPPGERTLQFFAGSAMVPETIVRCSINGSMIRSHSAAPNNGLTAKYRLCVFGGPFFSGF